jgi:hypothetical protein
MAKGILIRMEKLRELMGGAITQVRTGTERIECNSLEDLQAAVGGLIEAVQLTPEVHGWVNEEGKLTGLPVNDVATHLFRRAYPGTRDVIAGSMVLMGTNDETGDDVDLPQEWFDALDAGRGLYHLVKVEEAEATS